MDKWRAIRLISILLLFGFALIWIGYGTARTDFVQLVALYVFLIALYLFALHIKAFETRLSIFLGAALLLRVLLLFMTPNLTDDYFRYIWDGLLFTHGYNPYLILPSEFIHSLGNVPGITTTLYGQLNSAAYYTVYPPVCQFIFGLGAKLAGGNVLGNVIFFRFVILLAESGTIYLLYKLASKFRISSGAVAIYAFNPLVIIELTGNLHLEAVMLFFLVTAIYLLIEERLFYASISFGLAVAVKLVPLLFLPLLIKRLGLRKSLIFYTVVGIIFVVLFVPFLNVSLVPDFFSSLRLYFQTFEFNASLYYLFRWIGYQVTGYNTIAVLGVALAVVVFITIVTIALKEKIITWQSLFRSMLLCLTAYYLLATTVHPWYITPLVLLSVFTCYRYVVVWSALIIVSYAAYQTMPYQEHLWLIAMEYVVVIGWMVYELLKNKANLKSGANSVVGM